MSDPKSKMPDFNEIVSMAGKLFKDVKRSVSEIIAEYKSNHPNPESKDEKVAEESQSSKEPKKETKVAAEPEKEPNVEPEPKKDDK